MIKQSCGRMFMPDYARAAMCIMGASYFILAI